MAGQLTVKTKIITQRGGVAEPDRGDFEKAKAIEIVGEPAVTRRIVIPKRVTSGTQALPTLLWSWEEFPDAKFVSIRLAEKEGIVRIAEYRDKPLSTTDITPAGTHKNQNQYDLSCFCPQFKNAITCLVDSTPANACGLDGEGYPLLLSGETAVEGRFYKAWAINPSTTKDVTVEVIVES